MPIFAILFEYNTGIYFTYMNQSIHTKDLLENSLIIYSLFLITLKLGFLSKLKIKTLSKSISINNISLFFPILLFFLWLLSLQTPPGTILTGYEYAKTEYTKTITLNIIPILFFITFIIYISFIIKRNKLSKENIRNIFFFYIIGVIYFHFLKGSRVEALGLSISLYFIAIEIVNKKLVKKLTLFMLFLIIMLWIVGFIRSGNFDLSRIFVSFSTFSDIGNTYLICIDMINSGFIDLKGFDLIKDNLLSTLPKNFSPIDRPISIAAWLGTQYTSWGGIHWFGSIYLSFGYFGIIYVYLFGVFLGTLENYKSNIGSIGHLMFLITEFAFLFL